MKYAVLSNGNLEGSQRRLGASLLVSFGVLLIAGIGLAVGTRDWRQEEQVYPVIAEAGNFADLFEKTEEYNFDPPVPGSYALPPLKQAPDGQVLDFVGRETELAGLLKGKISLVSFVYVLCSDENGCPIAMSTLFNIHEASAELPALRDDVQLVTISFDPERDTPEAMASFAYPVLSDAEKESKLDWRFLTTSGNRALKPIIDGFGQAIDRSGDEDVINHLLRMYLVDRSGRIRNVYGLGMIDPRLLMTDIETLMMEEVS
ncbi:SCO family protein [Pelagibius sp. Alg239-R121]|uniref:SCO family protein n=1 Tax=Pelagibius sp. Alg239-R121 TaxID=2993448 RepID=UPI0024A72083|nr:SCO family protein [Pelagibius sp. Alg239-R121]